MFARSVGTGGLAPVPPRHMIRPGCCEANGSLPHEGQAQGPHLHSAPPPVPTDREQHVERFPDSVAKHHQVGQALFVQSEGLTGTEILRCAQNDNAWAVILSAAKNLSCEVVQWT